MIPRSFFIFIFAMALCSASSSAHAADVVITGVEGGIDYLDFGSVQVVDSAGTAKRITVERQLQVSISNTSRPYQVIQRINIPFRSQKGDAISDETMTFYVRGAKHGTMMPTVPVPFTSGETIVYSSDALGSSDTFYITYYLQADENLAAGRYEANLTFIVAER